jgi:hypothetical protein
VPGRRQHNPGDLTVAGVVDYSGAFPGVPALTAAGVTGVARYLSWLPNQKVITGVEYRTLTAGGIGVTLVWEYDAQDWLSGASAGALHAAEAVRQARTVGHPRGAGIYGGADFDMTRQQWLTYGNAYAVAFRDGVRAGGYRPGVYGPHDVLTWCRDLGYALYWQAGMSTAWSAGRNAAVWLGAQLRQVRPVAIAGTACDWNDVLSGDWGQGGGSIVDADVEYGLGVAFARPYDGIHGVSGSSYMAQAVQGPLQRLLQAAEAEKARDAANAAAIAGLTAAVNTLAAMAGHGATGGPLDTAAVLDRVDRATAEIRSLVAQQHAREIAALRAELETLSAADSGQVES